MQHLQPIENVLNSNIFFQEEPINSYKFQLTLTIKRLQQEDFGTYRCISKNSIGQAEELVELYGEFNLVVALSIIST